MGWTFDAFTVLLTLLFHGSTTFIEHLSRPKHSTYAEDPRSTSRRIPWFPRG